MAPDPYAADRDRSRGWLAAPLVSITLLLGLTADRVLLHLPTGDPGLYHEQVRQVAAAVPREFGDWRGADVEVPASAVAMLRPNVILGRRYVQARSGTRVDLMFVHCRDARDVGGHYPPVCYPSNGWRTVEGATRPRDFRVDGLDLPCTEYRFSWPDPMQPREVVVVNFILRPDGIDRDVDSLREAAYDPRRKVYGGGQVQVVFGGTLPEAERDRVFAEVVRACLPAVREVISGAAR